MLQLFIYFSSHHSFTEQLSVNSAELIMAEASSVHFIKEVGRSQIMGAAKTLLNKEEWQELKGAEKAKFIVPLAEVLLRKDIVQVTAGASFTDLSRNDVKKIGTF